MLDADIGEDTATTVGGSGSTAVAVCWLWASVGGKVGACESGAPPAAQTWANGQSVLALGTRREKTRKRVASCATATKLQIHTGNWGIKLSTCQHCALLVPIAERRIGWQHPRSLLGGRVKIVVLLFPGVPKAQPLGGGLSDKREWHAHPFEALPDAWSVTKPGSIRRTSAGLSRLRACPSHTPFDLSKSPRPSKCGTE